MKDNDTKTLAKNLVKVNIVLTATLLLIAFSAWRMCNHLTKTTKALSEVAQWVGVDFPTKTNNVLWVWEVVKPK